MIPMSFNKKINNSMDFTATVKAENASAQAGASLLSAMGNMPNVTVNVNGVQYQNFDELATAISEQLQFYAERGGLNYGT